MTDDLTTRVDKLTRDIGDLKDKRKDGWDKFQIIAALLIPASIAAVGFMVSKSLKEAEIASAKELASGQEAVARINARVGQAKLVNSFMDALLSEEPRKRKLAIEAMLIALPEDGPRLAELVSETDPDTGVRQFSYRAYSRNLFGGMDAAIDLREITAEAVTQEMFDRRKALMNTIDGLDKDKAIALLTKIETEFPEIKPFMARYTDAVRAADGTGGKAKTLLKQAVPLTANSRDDADKWQAAIDSL